MLFTFPFFDRCVLGWFLSYSRSSGGEEALVFLPAVYGYATTIRRAQGTSLVHGALFFDHCYPPERGYGYVGASRFRSKRGLYHYGKIRRTDWLPVGEELDSEQLVRSLESEGESDGSDAEEDARIREASSAVGLSLLQELYGERVPYHEEEIDPEELDVRSRVDCSGMTMAEMCDAALASERVCLDGLYRTLYDSTSEPLEPAEHLVHLSSLLLHGD